MLQALLRAALVLEPAHLLGQAHLPEPERAQPHLLRVPPLRLQVALLHR
jgi:hypothetical protein